MVETITREQIEQMPDGAEMTHLINTLIFGLQPLSDDEKKTIDNWEETTRSGYGKPVLELVFRNKEGRYIWGSRYDDIRTFGFLIEKLQEDGYSGRIVWTNEGVEVYVKGYGHVARAVDRNLSLALRRAALIAYLEDLKANPESTPHPFEGRNDGNCEICGLPDQASIHIEMPS